MSAATASGSSPVKQAAAANARPPQAVQGQGCINGRCVITAIFMVVIAVIAVIGALHYRSTNPSAMWGFIGGGIGLEIITLPISYYIEQHVSLRALGLTRKNAYFQDRDGRDALHRAAFRGDTDTIRLWLRSGLDIDRCAKRNNNALTITLIDSHWAAAEMLADAYLARGINVDQSQGEYFLTKLRAPVPDSLIKKLKALGLRATTAASSSSSSAAASTDPTNSTTT